MTQRLLDGSPLKRSARIGGVLLLCVAAIVGLFYFTRSSREMWMNSVSLDALKTEGSNNPNDAELNFTLAHRMVMEGRSEEAYAVMQRLVQQHPDNVQYLIGLARCSTELMHPVETVNVYNKVLSLDPRQGDVYMSLGQIYGEAGLLTDALEKFEKGSQVAPNAEANNVVWIRCLVAKGRYQEAWDRATAILEKSPKIEDLYEFTYTAGVPLGKSSELENTLLKRLNMFGSYHGSAAKSALARLMIAEQKDEKTLVTAEMLAAESAKGQGARADDFAALGEVRLLRNDLKGARSALEDGLKTDANDPACLKALAEVAKRQGQKAEAERLQVRLRERIEGGPEVSAQRNAVRAAPKDAATHLALAGALEKAGDFGAAAEECHEALRLAPKDSAATARLDECRLKALEKLAKESAAKYVR